MLDPIVGKWKSPTDMKLMAVDNWPFGRWSDRNMIKVPTVGKFYLQTVGNTSYSTAVDVYFWRQHAVRRRQGNLRYRPVIDPHGTIVWRQESISYAVRNLSLPEAYQEHVDALLDNLPVNDPVGYVFLIMSAADMELVDHHRKIEDMQRSYEHYHELLSGRENVPLDKLDPEARQQRLTMWMRQLGSTEIRLRIYLDENETRIRMLKRISRGLRRWCAHVLPEHWQQPDQLIKSLVSETYLREPPPFMG